MNYLKKDIKKTIPFTIITKRVEYLGINLTKEEKHLYTENYKILMKETEEQINGKIYHVHGSVELILPI